MNDAADELSDVPVEATVSRDGATLLLNLASRLSYLKLYQAVSRGLLERDALPLVEAFVDEEREAIARLAGQIRQFGYPVEAEADAERLIAQLRARRGTVDRLEFLQRGIEKSAEWYESRSHDEELTPAVRLLCAELGAQQRERQARLAALVAKLV